MQFQCGVALNGHRRVGQIEEEDVEAISSERATWSRLEGEGVFPARCEMSRKGSWTQVLGRKLGYDRLRRAASCEITVRSTDCGETKSQRTALPVSSALCCQRAASPGASCVLVAVDGFGRRVTGTALKLALHGDDEDISIRWQAQKRARSAAMFHHFAASPCNDGRSLPTTPARSFPCKRTDSFHVSCPVPTLILASRAFVSGD